MTEFEKGQKWFAEGKQVTGRHGTFKAEFIRGFDCECRMTRSGYLNQHWNKQSGYKSL